MGILNKTPLIMGMSLFTYEDNMPKSFDELSSEIAEFIKKNSLYGKEEIVEALIDREKKLEELLSFFSIPDKNQEYHCKVKELYKGYQEDINELLAHLEVNTHDLDKEVLGVIFDLNSAMILANSPDAIQVHIDTAYNVLYNLIHLLQKKLVDSYIARIQQYRRFVKNFNQKGVKIDEVDTSFYDGAKAKWREIKAKYREWRNTHKGNFILDDDGNYLPTKKEIGLTAILKLVKELNSQYESYYALIIDNGYSASVSTKIFNFALILFPAGLLILSIYLTFFR